MKYKKLPTTYELYGTDENTYKNRELEWQEGEYTVYRDHQFSAPGCHNSCGMLYYVKDGKVEKVEGDPTEPFNRGRACMRCLNLPEIMYHPERVTHPMRRVGERGENKWEQISWDEAYADITEHIKKYSEEFGPESIVGIAGTARNIVIQMPALFYGAIKSPNNCMAFLSGTCCYLPRMLAEAKACGERTIIDTAVQHPDGYMHPEYEVPEVIVVWGKNGLRSNADGTLGHWIVDLMRQGTKLIVVDPSLTWFAARADVWLRIRPGTDGAMALAWANVIINEDLYDHEFIEKWSYGFEQYAERCSEWTPERAAEICWVDAEKIRAAARMYANAKPASLEWGVALDQTRHAMANNHAVHNLRAMTGNLDIPGGEMFARHVMGLDSQANSMIEWVPPEELDNKRFGCRISPFTVGHMGATAHPDTCLKALEIEDPYPVKMLMIYASNPMANIAAEPARVRLAMKNAEYIVGQDYYMTPTVIACADIVLPIAMSPERNSISINYSPLKAERKFVDVGETRSDDQISAELGHLLDPEGSFKYIKTDVDFCDGYLRQWKEPSEDDYTFDQLVNEDKLIKFDEWLGTYRKYEKGMLRPDGQPGFATPTGRYEFYVSAYAAWGGIDPLADYTEPVESPYSRPDLYEEYPLVLTTGQRAFEFFHSEGRNQPTMREFHPWPIVEMHPNTAAKYGVEEGDWIWIENHRGKCKQLLRYNVSLDERVIRAEHGWWFPEREGAEPSLYGTFDSNINNLVPQFQYGPSAYGAPYKCLLCKVYKVTPENDESVTKRLLEEGLDYEPQYELED